MKQRQIRFSFSLGLILVGIAINLCGVQLATGFAWWLFLDSIGTVLAAALGGILPGVIVGFISNFINGLSDPITLYYGLVSVLIAAVSVLLARHHAFNRLWSALLCSLPLAAIGGGLGSLLTWLLYGFDFGSGISAPLALTFFAGGLPKLLAQLSADLVLDLFDKLLTVLIVYLLLRFLPRRWLSRAPKAEWLNTVPGTKVNRKKMLGSLRNKVVLLIVLTAVILSSLAVTISFIIYKDTMNSQYISTGKNVTSVMSTFLNGDRVEDYLLYGEGAPDYQEEEKMLLRLKQSVPEIKYMYVYQIREDGCHVVFDLDTDDLEGASPGSIQPLDAAFADCMPNLLAGKEIEPVISKSEFGYLLTVYSPLFDSNGQCVAYTAVDIDMENVIADRYVFVIRMVSLLFGASIIIIAVAVIYAQNRFVEPIDTLADATSHFAFDSDTDRRSSTQTIQTLRLKTGDEIENLCSAISKTVTDMSGYINQIAERNEFIAKMQDNIIVSFATMVEKRDDNTGQHIRRTAAYVSIIGQELLAEKQYPDELTDATLQEYVKSAPLHDIGKIKIPDAILNKPGRLTPEEFAVIQTHTTAGGEILRSAMEGIESSSYLNCATDMALYHHERWDGNGYPIGKSGTEIPLCARIMALADVFDALRSRRSYKEAIPFDQAVEIIRKSSGTHFDPLVVEAFLHALPRIQEIKEE